MVTNKERLKRFHLGCRYNRNMIMACLKLKLKIVGVYFWQHGTVFWVPNSFSLGIIWKF